MSLPSPIETALACAHASWQPHLRAGLAAMDQDYLRQLASGHFLPTQARLFAAFQLPIGDVRYVLVGEGPYPREESATGVCFMDGAVGSLWCEGGLSKPVNRATSLRNFMKMLLVADGKLHPERTGGAHLAPIAAAVREQGMIDSMAELQENLIRNGFLLLNASLVFRDQVPPAADARAWQPFLRQVLLALAGQPQPPTLVLWGKIAEQLKALPEAARFAHLLSEHPFNLSFIQHAGMQALFGPMRLLQAGPR